MYKISSLFAISRGHPISTPSRLNLTLDYGYVYRPKGMNTTTSDNITLLKQLWQQDGDNAIYGVEYKQDTLEI